MLDLTRYFDLTKRAITNRVPTPLAPMPRGPAVTEFPKITRHESVPMIPEKPASGTWYKVTGDESQSVGGLQISGSDFIIECVAAGGHRHKRTGAGSTGASVVSLDARRAFLHGVRPGTRQRSNGGVMVEGPCEQVIVSRCHGYETMTPAQVEALADKNDESAPMINYILKVSASASHIALVDCPVGVVDRYGIYPMEPGKGPLDIVWCVLLNSISSHTFRSYCGDLLIACCVVHNPPNTTKAEGWRNSWTQKIGDLVRFINGDGGGITGFGPLGDDPNHAKLANRSMRNLSILNSFWDLDKGAFGYERGLEDFAMRDSIVYTSNDRIFSFDYLTHDGRKRPRIDTYMDRAEPSGVVEGNQFFFAPGVQQRITSGDPKPAGFKIGENVVSVGTPPPMKINAAEDGGATPGGDEETPGDELGEGDAMATVQRVRIIDAKTGATIGEVTSSGGSLSIEAAKFPAGGINAVADFDTPPTKAAVSIDGGRTWRDEVGTVTFAKRGFAIKPGETANLRVKATPPAGPEFAAQVVVTTPGGGEVPEGGDVETLRRQLATANQTIAAQAAELKTYRDFVAAVRGAAGSLPPPPAPQQ